MGKKKLNEMEKGGIYGIFKEEKRFAILKLEGRKKGRLKNYNDVKKEIK